MSDSLYSLQSDIQRLALQQTQIQNLMNTAAEVGVGVKENKQGHPPWYAREVCATRLKTVFFVSKY